MSAIADAPVEQREAFACFGSHCTVIVADADPAEAAAAALRARRRLLGWHEQFSRFQADSELTRLNDDPGETVVVSPLMRRVVEAGIQAARATDGLVDPTLLTQIERVGYQSHFEGPGLPLLAALAQAPARRPGQPAAAANWRLVGTDRRTSSVKRPAGVRIDAGGIAKGVFADELAATLAVHDAFVVDCGGDLRLGGRSAPLREVHVASPFEDAILHTFGLANGRRRDERDRQAQLDRRQRRRRPPPARPRHRTAGVHRRRAGHGAGADRHRGGDAEQGGAPARPRGRRPGARARRCDRARQRRPRGARPGVLARQGGAGC